MEEQTQYLTEKEVAKITSIKVGTLRSHRVRGVGIPYFKTMGKTVRYRLADVLKYMESNPVSTNG